jgi:hypothetical protein
MNKNINTFIEMVYIIFMWNFFKTNYSFHNIWEAPLMNHKQMPQFFKHTIDTGIYESKICPLGNAAAFALAGWIFFRDVISKNSLRMKKLNLLIFSTVLILSFIMNLNAFVYFIPIFIYEFKLI